MRYTSILISLMLVALVGCKSSDSDENTPAGEKISISASGLTDSVFLIEKNSKVSHEITSDGVFEIELPYGQKMYDLEITASEGQYCQMNEGVELSCEPIACTTDYTPVCAKEPLAGVQCVTTPCKTDRYKTFSNACEADVTYALIALQSECLGLENVEALDTDPVIVTELASTTIIADPFSITSQSISNNTLTTSFEVTGGCGSHDFQLYANNIFSDSQPSELSITWSHAAHDTCETIVNIDKQIDLLPIKELYRRANPDATGAQTVIIEGVGEYNFTL